MAKQYKWNREQLLVAFSLYCEIPFGKLHSRNPTIVKYAEAIGRTPSALAMKLTNIASLDPAITTTGRKGLKGASSADKDMWKEMQEDWEKFFNNTFIAMRKLNISIDTISDSKEKTINYSSNNRTVQSKVRIGQSFFRKSVLSAYDYKCCITGLSIPSLLVASHIIPWRIDISNRLNPKNGLALSMLHDKAFDIGLITINSDMTLAVSKIKLMTNDDFYNFALLKYDGKPIKLPEKFKPQIEFQQYHRKHIFQK